MSITHFTLLVLQGDKSLATYSCYFFSDICSQDVRISPMGNKLYMTNNQALNRLLPC